MPQLYFSVDRPLADELARRAADENLPLSKYLARLVREQVQEAWPDDYLTAVIGCCADDPLEEPTDDPPDEPEAETTLPFLEGRS